MAKWVKTKFPGVRFREHPTRKNGVKRDQYFTIRYKLNGNDKEEGLGWATEDWTAAKAYDRLKELKENRKAGEGPQTLAEKRKIEDARKAAEKNAQEQAEKENITFGAFMTKTYLPQCKLDKKPKTYDIEEMLFRRHLADTIGPLPFSKISPFHLERVKKNMADKKLSDRSIQYVLQLTRQAFNRARKFKIYTGESPTDGVTWPRLDNMKLRYLSIAEAEKLLAVLTAKSRNLADIALLSLHCGLRFGEIAKLTWSCVNSEAGTLAIFDAKTGSRTAYLTAQARATLESRKRGKPNELIFPKRSGKDGAMNQASKVFTETVKELGFNDGITDRKNKVTFHTLRHSMATHLYESTHDLYLTQRSLGHTTSTMTMRYAKMSENRLREGAAALEAAFKKKEQKKTPNAEKVVNFPT